LTSVLALFVQHRAWSERYEPMISLFNRIYEQSEEYWDAFSALGSLDLEN